MGRHTLQLDIKRDSHNRLSLVSKFDKTVLYRADISHGRNGDISVYQSGTSTSADPRIGQALFTSLKSDIKIQSGGEMVKMKRKGLFSETHVLNGPGFSWAWEKKGLFSKDVRLLDGQGRVLAEFDNAAFSTSNRGTLTIMGSMDSVTLCWIVVSALAKIEYTRRKAKKAAVAGANA